MAWIQLKVSVPKHYAEDVGDVLAAHGAVAVTFQDAHDTPVLEPLPAETRLWKSTIVAALYSAETDITQLLTQLQNDLAVKRIILSDQWEPVVERLEDQDWLRESMAQFQPLQFGRRLWICPSWLPTPDPTAVNVVLDPGLAFGTGTHPTTALCLEWLESLNVLGRRIIDFGCGSGILAIAALKLGACSAVGIDIDPQALQASHDNAQRNGVADRLTLYLADQQPSDLQAEVVVANILAGPLKALATPISQLVAAGGHLALSGILLEQAEAVRVAYHKQWRCYSMTEREGWCCITAQVRDQQSEKEKTNNQRS